MLAHWKPYIFTLLSMIESKFVFPRRWLTQYNGPMTWAAMGRCYSALHEFAQAEECFTLCANANPSDFDSRLRLAEILESTNRKEEAKEIVDAGISPSNMNNTVKRDREHSMSIQQVQDEDISTGALIPNRKRTSNTSGSTMRPQRANEEKALAEARLKDQTLRSWDKLCRSKVGMESGNRKDVEIWMIIAKRLIEEFKSFKSFFPWEKGRPITFFDDDTPPANKAGRKRKLTDIDSRVQELQSRMKELSGTSLKRNLMKNRLPRNPLMRRISLVNTSAVWRLNSGFIFSCRSSRTQCRLTLVCTVTSSIQFAAGSGVCPTNHV